MNAIKVGTTLVGLTLAAALAGLGCGDSGGSPTGKGGTTGSAGKGGTTGTAGTAGTTGSGGTGGSVGGTTGSGGTGGSTAGTTGSGGTAGTGGSTGGTGGVAGSNSAGTGGSSTGGAGATGSGGTGGAGGTGLPANLPPTLNPPAGATLKLRVHATGDQVYTCTASSAAGTGGGAGAGGTGGAAATTYAYVLKQPDAKLWDWDNTTTQVGTHGMGPNWTSTVDSSVVNGARAYGENASGTIPWLLLRATSNSGTGVFSDVTYVIRANTTGGVAPATGCDSNTAGTDTRVAYTADYYFYNGGGPGTAWLTPPANLPTAIAVPSGATVKLHDHAIGWQVYTCTASAAGGTSGTGAGGAGGAGGTGGSGATTYSWVLKQPDAMLYDSSFAQVGTHGMGPNWTSTDGSVVNGARVAGANSTMTGAIQWLLLMATSNTGTGVFSDVTFIQRLNTAGGPAPATGCDSGTTGTETRIPYSADYYFFTGGVAVDGGTNG